jgi:diacylglycerol kinase family enzyme
VEEVAMDGHGTGTGYLVLANQAAGSADPDRLFRATRPLAAAGPTEVRLLQDEDDLARALSDLGERTAVIAGGDGTVHRVIAGLQSSEAVDRPVGILPLGTANDLARGLGLPLDAERAAQRIVTGRPRPVTLVQVETRDAPGPVSPVVLNAVHLGVGALGASWAGRAKRAMGRLAYPAATATAGMVAGPLTGLTVVLDGVPTGAADAPLALVVANGGGLGGEEGLVPGARPDTASVTVVSIADPGRLRRPAIALAAARGRLRSLPGVTLRQGRVVELHREDGLEVDADGELEHWGSWCRLRARPAAWQVLDTGEGDDDRG